jgi:hypothetical protein
LKIKLIFKLYPGYCALVYLNCQTFHELYVFDKLKIILGSGDRGDISSKFLRNVQKATAVTNEMAFFATKPLEIQ